MKKNSLEYFYWKQIRTIINVNIQCHIIKEIMKMSVDEVRPWNMSMKQQDAQNSCD